MRDKKALQQSDKGFGVSIPGLPGCWLQGATEQEAIENIKDAIRDYLPWSKNNFAVKTSVSATTHCFRPTAEKRGGSAPRYPFTLDLYA